MANRATKFVSAIFVGALVGIPVSALAKDAAPGAEAGTSDSNATAGGSSTECLITPNREIPQGQRWFYRLEPGTNRRCWYLRDLAERASVPRSNPSQFPATPPTPRSVSKNAQPPRSLSNARAELGARSAAVESAGPTVPKTPVFITTGAAGANRGASAGVDTGQASSSTLTDTDSSGSSPDGTTINSPNAGATLNPGLSQSPASEDMPATANMPQEKASASLQLLFVVILSALAFAGIVASLTHRMARTWRRRHARSRRHSIWIGADGARRASWTAVAAAPSRSQDRTAGATTDEGSGQIRRFLTQITKRSGGKSKKRVAAKPQAASAARARTPSARRGVRA